MTTADNYLKHLQRSLRKKTDGAKKTFLKNIFEVSHHVSFTKDGEWVVFHFKDSSISINKQFKAQVKN